jgi:hypothetical protein
MAHRGARGRDTAEPGRQPGLGPADCLGPHRGRRAAGRVPGGGLDDRAPRRPPAPPRRRPGRQRGRAVRAGTAVPGARCRGRGPGRRGRGAARGSPPGRRRAPGRPRPADHPRRAARPARRLQPGRLRAVAPAPRRRGPAAGNLPGRLTPAPLPAPAPPGLRSAGRLPGVARLDRHREGVATYRDGLADCGPAGRSPPARPARDGQRKWQTVYPGSRTCAPSTSPANLLANTYSCRHRSPISVADVLDTAEINLPVDSQTCISAKLLKQSWMAGRTCVTYVNSPSVVRGNVSVQYPVLRPPGPCPPARACPAPQGRAAR